MCRKCQLEPPGLKSRHGWSGHQPSMRRSAPEPTAALPGTPEKFAVLCQRAAAGQLLWHPGDAVLDDDGEPVGLLEVLGMEEEG
jgi:hypothetical protein